VIGDSGRVAWLQQARSYLRSADPVLARLIDERPDFDPRAWIAQLPQMDLYGALLFQVTGQQLSVAATRSTLARIQALFGGHLPAPAELLDVDPGTLRAAGLSWRKIGTLRDPGPCKARSSSPSAGKMSCCLVTLRCARPSGPPTSSITSRPSRRFSTSPRNGGPTAAWRPATCSPPPSNPPKHHPAAAPES